MRVMRKNIYHERECVHREQGVEGEFYNGSLYIQSIQRLPGKDAVRVARQVEQFYWSDAANIMVWLCGDCAKTLRLNEAPRLVVPLTHQTRRVSSM